MTIGQRRTCRLVRCIWGTAAYVIRDWHLSPESRRRQTTCGASKWTVRKERIWKGGGALDVTRPTRISRPRRNNKLFPPRRNNNEVA